VLVGKEIPRRWIAGATGFRAGEKLTSRAFADALQPVFDQLDNNHDGQLEADEIAASVAARKTEQEDES
jgi:hypothetical protein